MKKNSEDWLPFDSFCDESSSKPDKTGWYAELHCWDPLEGFFPGSSYWDGDNFKGYMKGYPPPVTHFIDKCFTSESDALRFAYENDPNW